jgi:hypothetical protein
VFAEIITPLPPLILLAIIITHLLAKSGIRRKIRK